MIEIQEINPSDKNQRRQFVALTFLLAKQHPNWLPGLRLYYNDLINPAKNPFWKQQEFKLFVAKVNNEIVARLGFLLPGYFAAAPKTCVLILPETQENFAAFSALVFHVEKEIKNCGGKQIVGPFNPNIHYDIGVQISGFDSMNTAFMGYQPAYYNRFFEDCGYSRQADFCAWALQKSTFTDGGPLKKIEQRARAFSQLNIRPINMKHFTSELEVFYELYSTSFEDHWGFVRPTFEEFCFIAGDLKYLLKNELALVAEWHGRPVGFVLSVPNVYSILDKQENGKLTLKTVFNFVFKRNKIKTVRVMIAGVLPQYRRYGIHVALFMQIARNIFNLGFTGGQIAWVMDDNKAMAKILPLMGANRLKAYRVYQKVL